MISTARRVEYALGYVGLGLLQEAADELAAVRLEDRYAREVMGVRVELHIATQQWDCVAEDARRLLALDQDNVSAWVALGCALRRLDGVAAAKQLLLKADQLHGATHAVIAYNLACYTCLLGELEVAKAYFARACRTDTSFKAAGLTDPDLEGISDFVRAVNAA